MLYEQIKADIKASSKTRDKAKCEILKAVLDKADELTKHDNFSDEITDETVISLCKTEIETLRNKCSISQYDESFYHKIAVLNTYIHRPFKIEIELNEEQLGMIISALELYFRPLMNQWCDLAEHFATHSVDYYKNGEVDDAKFNMYLLKRDDITSCLEAINKIMYGRYGGYYNKEMQPDVHRVSDMYSAFRHIQFLLHPHDGLDVRSQEPFQLSDMEMIKIRLVDK